MLLSEAPLICIRGFDCKLFEFFASPAAFDERKVEKMACVHLSRAEFERVVNEALESLPKRFADLVDNVVIAIEDEPTDEDLESTDDDDGESELLGIYRGVALTERTHDMPLLPDEIAIFYGPINRVISSRQEAVREVRETVIHELGHYFGLDDDEMPH